MVERFFVKSAYCCSDVSAFTWLFGGYNIIITDRNDGINVSHFISETLENRIFRRLAGKSVLERVEKAPYFPQS